MIMRIISAVLFFMITLSFSQEKIEKEYFKNGQLKSEKIIKENVIIFKEFYKNGQEKYIETQSDNNITEEAYSKRGELIVKVINGNIEFSAYENAINELKNRNQDEVKRAGLWTQYILHNRAYNKSTREFEAFLIKLKSMALLH